MKKTLQEQFNELVAEDEAVLDFLPATALRKAIACYYKNKLSLAQIGTKIEISKQAVYQHQKSLAATKNKDKCYHSQSN